MLCCNCQKPTPANELLTYGNRCEDCAVDTFGEVKREKPAEEWRQKAEAEIIESVADATELPFACQTKRRKRVKKEKETKDAS